MKRIYLLVLLSFTVNISFGQKYPIQVSYDEDSNSSCGTVTLGSGFEKSGMVRYVARPKIIESKWRGRQLTITIFTVSGCCTHDYLGYVEQSDTLILYYGSQVNLPNKHSGHKEVEICMCGHNGCCFEFEYRITGLKKKTNYLVAISDVMGIGLIKPYLIGYIDEENKSIHYSQDCDLLEECLDKKIEEAVSNYKNLIPLYTLLIEQHKNENPVERETIDNIRRTWIRYFSCREAIYDEFIRSKLDQNVYSLKINEFESQVQSDLLLLESKLNITSEYLIMGSLREPIIENKK
jgi:hypothetical protein